MLGAILPSITLEIYTTYCLIRSFIFNYSMDVMYLLDHSVWASCLIVPKFVAIYVCSSCSLEARKLNILVDKRLTNCDNEEVILRVGMKNHQKLKINLVSFQLEALSAKIQLRAIAFNCGLFNIDWTLALSIFSTITTYMIIIFQYDKKHQ